VLALQPRHRTVIILKPGPEHLLRRLRQLKLAGFCASAHESGLVHPLGICLILRIIWSKPSRTAEGGTAPSPRRTSYAATDPPVSHQRFSGTSRPIGREMT
jgi:hypothetical protein